MFEFTGAFLKPFKWAQRAYEYMLAGLPSTSEIPVPDSELLDPISADDTPEYVGLATASDWNDFSTRYASYMFGCYASVDRAESYLQSIRNRLTGRLREQRRRIQELEYELSTAIGKRSSTFLSSLYIHGGFQSDIETNSRFYLSNSPFAANSADGVFELPISGSFSSLAPGSEVGARLYIERSLLKPVHEQPLTNAVDGAESTYWSCFAHAPAPVRASDSDVYWLPRKYTSGFAVMLTQRLSSPSLVSHIRLDPMSADPMDLVYVSWRDASIGPTVSPQFNTWQLVASANPASSVSGEWVLNVTGSGFGSYTFGLSAFNGVTDSSRRVEILFGLSGLGDLRAGARFVWLNASGGIIDTNTTIWYPTKFPAARSVAEYAPAEAASGRIDLGVFDTLTSSATAAFYQPRIYIGDGSWDCGKILRGPTLVELPYPIYTDRITLVLAQRNPRREILSVRPLATDVSPITAAKGVDPTLLEISEDISEMLSSRGEGKPTFVYRMGLRELDFVYREHFSGAALVTKPVNSRREIREIAVEVETDSNVVTAEPGFEPEPGKSELECTVYLDGESYQGFEAGQAVGLKPSLVYRDIDDYVPGTPLVILTNEELDAGFTPRSTNYVVLEPQKVVEIFDGTTKDGTVRCSQPHHVSRVSISKVMQWASVYAPWVGKFDPNAIRLLGSTKAMRTGTIQSLLEDPSNLVTGTGYRPVSVWVKTNRWVAIPDSLGSLKTNPVGTTFQQELIEGATDVKVYKRKPTYEEWARTTTFSNALEIAKTAKVGLPYAKQGVSRLGMGVVYIPKEAWDVPFDAAPDIVFWGQQKLSDFMRDKVGKDIYKIFDQKGLIQEIEITDFGVAIPPGALVFSTRKRPILTRGSNPIIRLYWYNPTTADKQEIPRNGYIVQPKKGIVGITASPPSDGHTKVLADYKYLTTPGREDFLGESLASDTPSMDDGASEIFELIARSLPITRNMTDYEKGTRPELRPPDFDPLSQTYYPVIEYYVEDDGTIVFSRDFFKYGDVPAQITVEYHSLRVNPRLKIVGRRSSIPSSSLNIYGCRIDFNSASSNSGG